MLLSWLLLVVGIGIATAAHYFPDSRLLEVLGLAVPWLAVLRILSLQLTADRRSSAGKSADAALPPWIAFVIFAAVLALLALGFWRTEYWFLLKVGPPLAGGGLAYLSLRFLGDVWGRVLLLGVGVGLLSLAALLYPRAFAHLHPAYHVVTGTMVVVVAAVTALFWRRSRAPAKSERSSGEVWAAIGRNRRRAEAAQRRDENTPP